MNRAGEAGKLMGEAIVEVVHLMYQRNTALRFLDALSATLSKEIYRRLVEKEKK